MRSVKSLSEATRLAAQSGASLDVGGRVINASGARMAVTKPAPAPTPEPPKPDPIERLAEVLQMQARITAQQSMVLAGMLADVAERLQAPEAAKPVTRLMPVEFTVVRDSTGRAVALIPVYGQVATATPEAT